MKIMHISDLHFGQQRKNIIPAFMKDVHALQPDMILISGDLTHRALIEQYEALNRFLKKLPCEVGMVPGNHDIPLYNVLARLFAPFKNYNKYIGLNTHHQFINESVRVLGVNSANPYRIKDGRLAAKTMKLIKHFFASPFSGLNILFFHHNFDYLEGLHKPLENYQEFLDYLRDSPIHMVCTGHSHFANVSFVKKNEDQDCMVLHAGTLLCTRHKDGFNSYYLMEIEGLHCTVSWRVFKKNSFETMSTYEMDFQKNTSIVPST